MYTRRQHTHEAPLPEENKENIPPKSILRDAARVKQNEVNVKPALLSVGTQPSPGRSLQDSPEHSIRNESRGSSGKKRNRSSDREDVDAARRAYVQRARQQALRQQQQEIWQLKHKLQSLEREHFVRQNGNRRLEQSVDHMEREAQALAHRNRQLYYHSQHLAASLRAAQQEVSDPRDYYEDFAPPVDLFGARGRSRSPFGEPAAHPPHGPMAPAFRIREAEEAEYYYHLQQQLHHQQRARRNSVEPGEVNSRGSSRQSSRSGTPTSQLGAPFPQFQPQQQAQALPQPPFQPQMQQPTVPLIQPGDLRSVRRSLSPHSLEEAPQGTAYRRQPAHTLPFPQGPAHAPAPMQSAIPVVPPTAAILPVEPRPVPVPTHYVHRPDPRPVAHPDAMVLDVPQDAAPVTIVEHVPVPVYTRVVYRYVTDDGVPVESETAPEVVREADRRMGVATNLPLTSEYKRAPTQPAGPAPPPPAPLSAPAPAVAPALSAAVQAIEEPQHEAQAPPTPSSTASSEESMVHDDEPAIEPTVVVPEPATVTPVAPAVEAPPRRNSGPRPVEWPPRNTTAQSSTAAAAAPAAPVPTPLPIAIPTPVPLPVPANAARLQALTQATEPAPEANQRAPVVLSTVPLAEEPQFVIVKKNGQKSNSRPGSRSNSPQTMPEAPVRRRPSATSVASTSSLGSRQSGRPSGKARRPSAGSSRFSEHMLPTRPPSAPPTPAVEGTPRDPIGCVPHLPAHEVPRTMLGSALSPIITCDRYVVVEQRHPQFIQVLPVEPPQPCTAASMLRPGGIDCAPEQQPQRSNSITPLKGMQGLSIASPKEPQQSQAVNPRPRRRRSSSPHSASRSDSGSEGTATSIADRPAWRGPMDLRDAGLSDDARRRWEARKQIEAEQRRKAKDNSWKAHRTSPKKGKKEGKAERTSFGGISGDDMQLDNPSRRNTKSPNPEENRRLTGESAVSARSTASADSATFITTPGGPTFPRMLVLDNSSAQQMTVQRIDGALPASRDYAGRKAEDVPSKPYRFFK